MIYVYFWAGTFGSTIEYVLRSFTNEYTPVNAKIAQDGSMHQFYKFHHLTNAKKISNFINQNLKLDSIATVTYPSDDNLSLAEITTLVQPSYNPSDKFILLYVNNLEYAEINRLFQYYKILNGAVYNRGLTSIVFDNAESILSKWNPSYKNVDDLKPWELREWQSLFDYRKYIEVPTQVDNKFIKISTEEILNNTVDTFEKIIDFCGLTRSADDLSKFANEWRQKQQYVLDEHKLIIEIVNATINNISRDIPEDLNIFAQSLIQQRLRRAGYEIQCDGLDKLPKNTALLYQLLYKDSTLHKEHT